MILFNAHAAQPVLNCLQVNTFYYTPQDFFLCTDQGKADLSALRVKSSMVKTPED